MKVYGPGSQVQAQVRDRIYGCKFGRLHSTRLLSTVKSRDATPRGTGCPHKTVVDVDVATNAGEEELEQSSQQPKVLGRLAVRIRILWMETPAARGPSIEELEDCDCDCDTTVLGRTATPPCFPVCGDTSGIAQACDRPGSMLLLSSSEGMLPLLGLGKQGIES